MDAKKDFTALDNGDIEITDNTLKLAGKERSLRQGIEKRLRTNNPDWYRHFNIGSDLEDLKGLDNTRETANLGLSKIERSLTYDGFIPPEDLEVRVVPTDKTELTYFIIVSLGYDKVLTLEFPVDIA